MNANDERIHRENLRRLPFVMRMSRILIENMDMGDSLFVPLFRLTIAMRLHREWPDRYTAQTIRERIDDLHAQLHAPTPYGAPQ